MCVCVCVCVCETKKQPHHAKFIDNDRVVVVCDQESGVPVVNVVTGVVEQVMCVCVCVCVCVVNETILAIEFFVFFVFFFFFSRKIFHVERGFISLHTQRTHTHTLSLLKY